MSAGTRRVRNLILIALAIGFAAWYAGRLSRSARARRQYQREETERWEGEGGAAP
jgi:hypothetical protein